MEQYSYTSTHIVGHTGPVMGSLYLFIYYYCAAVEINIVK
jgi:hypothetical protein